MKNKILVLGANGLVGSTITELFSKNFSERYEIFPSTRNDTNLFLLKETKKLIDDLRPQYIINAAAKVGGIYANNKDRTEFILENLKINMNILESIIPYPEINLINLGSSCIYPLNAPNPISEDCLMSGKLEPTNSPYAMAKLTAIEIGDSINKQFGHNIVNLMPTNLYGPRDNFSPTNSHVIPGLIYRMSLAKKEKQEKFEVWGTGKPKREFLHANDLAEAIHFVIENNVNETLLNIGSGSEVTILELSDLIREVVGYQGEIIFNKSMPDGNNKKLLDSSKITNLGWSPKINLKDGLNSTYSWFLKNIKL